MIKHLAIIMDGNGRWAESRGEPRLNGHKVGAEKVKEVIEAAKEMGIEVLSLYAFSTENFKRPKEEVLGIFGMIADALDSLLPKAMEKNVRFRIVGDLTKLPEDLLESVVRANKQTLNNSGMTVCVMLSYGGMNEVATAVSNIVKHRVMSGNNEPVSEEEIKSNLFTANLPDPDVVVRYGGEMRLSNFMPLQTIYSELVFLKKFWPEFEKGDLKQIEERFERIHRRFGDVK